MSKPRWYVGVSREALDYRAFQALETPSGNKYPGNLYSAIMGPFRTKRGAIWAERYGKGNVHFQTVDDAEIFAKIDAALQGGNVPSKFNDGETEALAIEMACAGLW